MKTTTLILIALLHMLNQPLVKAQNLIDSWVQSAGGESFDLATDMAIDNENNLYVTGNFQDTTYFGSTRLVSSGNFDIFLVKYDKNGSVIWAKSFGGKDYDQANSMEIDSKNNVYLCGTYMDFCKFDNLELKADSYNENFIAALNPLGKTLWANPIKGTTKGEATMLKMDEVDNLYFAGSFYKTIFLGDFNLQSTSGSDIFISKLQSDGQFVEATSIGGQGNEKLKAITCNKKGDVFITGSFSHEIDFDGQLLKSVGNEDVFIAAFTAFKPVWAKQAGGYYTDFANNIILNNNHILIAGSFTDEALFGTKSLRSEGVLDAFVCAYSFDGETMWAYNFGGPSDDYVNSLMANNDGSFYINGSYRGTIQQMNTKLVSDKFSNDIFMAKYSGNGSFLWAKSIGGDQQDFAVCLFRDKDNYIYQIGSYSNNLKIGDKKAITLGKSNDFFINKFYDCDNSVKVDLGKDSILCEGTALTAKGEFKSYLWNTSETEQSIKLITGGKYSVVAIDKMGCTSKAEVEIDIEEAPKVDLGPDIVAGTNQTIVLATQGGFTSYLWSDNSTGKTLVLPPTIYDKTEEITLTVTNENGCSATDKVTVTRQTSLNTNSLDGNNGGYTFFPNPTKGKFYIAMPNPGYVKQVDVYDLRGNLVKSIKNIKDFPIRADLTGQAKGAYIVKISEVMATREFRVVVE